MYTSFLLALPLLAPVLGHTIPRHPHAHRAAIPATLIAERDDANLSERSIPKAHFGIAPHNANGLSGVAGFQKRDGQRKVRRRKSKRSCPVGQHPVGVPNSTVTSSLGGGLHANPSASASATSSDVVAPAITSASATYSNASSYTYEASTSASSAAPAQSSTTSSSGSGGLSGLLAYVFPQGRGTADWTTVVDEAGSMSFDGALKPVTFGKLPSAGNAPDGSYALVANYPAGTVKLSAPGHGYSFYSTGNNDGIEITGAKEVVFSYSIMFQAGFQFNKGGKLPGLYGGTSLDMAKSCSGGRQNDRDDCFSARLMWRKDGMGEIYNYLPSAAYNNGNYCSTPPMSVCDPTYGESIGRGAFTWSSDGSWDTVAIRLKLNDANVANGEQEVFINGKSVISLKDLMISVNSDTKIYGIMAQTFFGGSDSSWASPQDQSAYFKDWSLAVLA